MQVRGNQDFVLGKYSHYYGYQIRTLFFLGAIIIFINLFFLYDSTPISLLISIAAVLAIGCAAGFTSPERMWLVTIDAVISAIALISYMYLVISFYQKPGFLVWSYQLLALIFLAAFYYASKTLWNHNRKTGVKSRISPDSNDDDRPIAGGHRGH